jgi:hypothetical protein
MYARRLAVLRSGDPQSAYGNYADTVGLRNSHDKSFPIGIAFGSRVFVCDNTAFVGEHVIQRKHTVKAKRELPGLITEIVQPLQQQRIEQNTKLLTLPGHAADGCPGRPRDTANISQGRNRRSADW